MADKAQVMILKEKGVKAWNEWRKANPKIRTDLSGLDFVSAERRRADLHGVDLSRTNISGADLSQADLIMANFSHTDLSGANLSEADLSEADLSKAKLNGTMLIDTNFSHAHLRGTDFQSSIMGATQLGNIDLSRAMGLEMIEHFAPSTIGIDTIYRSAETFQKLSYVGRVSLSHSSPI